MKLLNTIVGVALLSGALSLTSVLAADPPAGQQGKVVPYPLKTCLVTDEKFGGDMGDPYVFTNGNRQIKFCCKGCLKDFNKDTTKYLKKLEAADKKAR